MYKVIIADDEKKVCQLINMLVDWKEFDMEVVGVVHNGLEVLDMINEHSPNLIITDIRMPGLNGLEMIEKVKMMDNTIEFIIISGYRHFDYAHTAIQFGVYDYLLKPIKKEELTSTLGKMKEKLNEKSEMIFNYERLKKNIETSKVKLRKGLFTEMLFKGNWNDNNVSIDRINIEYQYNFKEGCFQVICLKLDHIRSLNQNVTSVLEEKSTQILINSFRTYCYDMEIYIDQNFMIGILNFSQDNLKAIRKQINAVLNENIMQDVIYQQMDLTIGLGNVVTEIDKLKESYKRSVYALQQRILVGTNKVLEFDKKLTTSISDSQIFYDFNQSFTASVSNLDMEAVIKNLEALKRNLLERAETTGHEILQMTKEVCNVYLLCIRSNKILIDDSEHFIQEFSEAANDCSSVHELFKLLNKTITESLGKILEEKKQMNTKPIRLAKQYIENNYMKPITLDDVSTIVGFNTTYFSTVFKKETGYTFLEYLSNIRMNKSKELLKETNKNIAAVCEEVGYSDVKYFTRSFKKHTGLKPNEFRKLYS
jgi:two-component system response regulator YesN